MSRPWRASALAGLTALSLWAPLAASKSGPQDAFLLATPDREVPSAAVSEVEARGLWVSSSEARLGVPTFVFGAPAAGEALAPARALAPASADAAARVHLQSLAPLYRLGRGDIQEAQLLSLHQPALGQAGAVVARYGRRVEGVEVFRSEVKVVMDAGNNLVAVSGYLAPPTADERQNARAAAYRLSAPEAIALAAREVADAPFQARALVPAGQSGDYLNYGVDAALAPGLRFPSPPRAKRVLWTMPDSHLPAWYVEVNVGTPDSTDAPYVAFVISARDGAILLRHDLSASESFTYRVWADSQSLAPHDGPQGTSATPHPTGLDDGYQAPFVPTSLVTLQNAPFSRNDPWLPANAMRTIGNNVEAYADLGGGDGFQAAFDHHAVLTGPQTFDFTFDPQLPPGANALQRSAAIVNLFYVTNYLHDWFYDAGFDEAAGNAQASNYGRGGIEGDSLRVEAQDYGGRNNANMSTPADGGRPRMQQYVFDGAPELVVTAPANLAGPYEAFDAAFNRPDYDVSASLALPPTASDQATDVGLRLGCADSSGTNPYTGTPFSGKIAVIERGSCSFVYKVLNAQLAGAVGVVVTNTATSALGRMGGSGIPAVDGAVAIPSMMVSKQTGDALRNGLAIATIDARLRKSAALDRDGTLDNAIVAHEWGHYLSNRLIGNGSGLSNHQGRGLGEGWSDFVALLLMVRPEDVVQPSNANWRGVYGLAGYATSGGANQGYYWGIRRVPYTTDMTKNGLRLGHMATGVALPSHPVAFGRDGAGNSQFHNTGEVWATMLWECYVSLLNAHPFQEAQDRMKRYLIAALKATPVQPTLLEARDALLAVANANDPADGSRFINAFAKRGAGWGAQVADRGSQDHVGVRESHSTGSVVEVLSFTLDEGDAGCDRDGILDADETGRITLTLRNPGRQAIQASSAAVTVGAFQLGSGSLAFPQGGTIQIPAIAPGATVRASLPVVLVNAQGRVVVPLSVSLGFPTTSGSQVVQEWFLVNYDERAAASNVDHFDLAYTPWTVSHVGAGRPWSRSISADQSAGWHLDDPSGAMDAQLISPVMRGSAGESFQLGFLHRYSFETSDSRDAFYDGGVIELSVDGGPWRDVFEFNQNPSYIAYLADGGPLGGRPAYAGMSPGFPDYQTVTMNFGNQFQGRSVQVRFRAGADVAVGAYGWDLKHVEVLGAGTPFPGAIPEVAGGVCNQRPIANAGMNQTTAERDGTGALATIHLTGRSSFDPDGTGPLTYAWTQRAGPPVALIGMGEMEPRFVADVAQDTIFTFDLVVHDGTSASLPSTVQVRVLNSNRAPTAVARVKDAGPTVIDERNGSVTLDATGSSDPDGSPLNFTWVQTEGLPVTLDDPASATPTFTPPEVNAETAFTFQLVADDGEDASAPADVTITVRNVDRAPISDAGPAALVLPGSTVQLRGSVTDADGDAISSVSWTQLDGPAVSLTGADTATASFTAPTVSTRITLAFQLTGTANGVVSAPSVVEVTVAGENHAPVLSGVTRSTALSGAQVSLSVSAFDPDADPLTYAWTQLSGPPVSLVGAQSAAATFTAPTVSADTALVLQVVASDGVASSEPMQVTITVTPGPRDEVGGGGGCSATGGGATGALLPALGLMAALLVRRRRTN